MKTIRLLLVVSSAALCSVAFSSSAALSSAASSCAASSGDEVVGFDALPQPEPLTPQTCNAVCQDNYTQCLDRCDGRRSCMKQCGIAVEQCVAKCQAPEPEPPSTSPTASGSSSAPAPKLDGNFP